MPTPPVQDFKVRSNTLWCCSKKSFDLKFELRYDNTNNGKQRLSTLMMHIYCIIIMITIKKKKKVHLQSFHNTIYNLWFNKRFISLNIDNNIVLLLQLL